MVVEEWRGAQVHKIVRNIIIATAFQELRETKGIPLHNVEVKQIEDAWFSLIDRKDWLFFPEDYVSSVDDWVLQHILAFVRGFLGYREELQRFWWNAFPSYVQLPDAYKRDYFISPILKRYMDSKGWGPPWQSENTGETSPPNSKTD